MWKSILCGCIFLASSLAFGEISKSLPNLKYRACQPMYSDFLSALNPLFQETSDHILAELKRRRIEVERITPALADSILNSYSGVGIASVFDYVAVVPVEIVTKKGQKLTVVSSIIDTDSQRVTVKGLALPLWMADTGSGATCIFGKGQDVWMGEEQLEKVSIIDGATKRTLVSGLFGMFTPDLSGTSEYTNQTGRGRRPDRGPGSCIVVPPGVKCPACCPN